MEHARSILIADDEDSFLQSTAELLRGDGYQCDAVPDARAALAKLRAQPYDVLIADIKMPGNPNLELVQEVERVVPGLPVVLVTGYPAVDSAVRSIQLPVVAYLEKPIPYGRLRQYVEASLQYSQAFRTVSQVQEHLRRCIEDLDEVKRRRWSPQEAEQKGSIAVPTMTLRTLAACASELLRLEREGGSPGGSPVLCELLDCPQWPAHRDAIRKAVRVLQDTKRRFRSKELADIRELLEGLLEGPQPP
jgi:FixJ family two-component response regulator